MFGGGREEGRMFQAGYTTHGMERWPVCVQCVHFENENNLVHELSVYVRERQRSIVTVTE